MIVLKVSASSEAKKVAGALSGAIREAGKAELQCIGAAAVNVGVKAIAISRGHVAVNGVDLICIPGFKDVVIDQEERTAILLLVQPR